MKTGAKILTAALVTAALGIGVWTALHGSAEFQSAEFENAATELALKARETDTVPKWLPMNAVQISALKEIKSKDSLLTFLADEEAKKTLSETCSRIDKSVFKFPRTAFDPKAPWWDRKEAKENVASGKWTTYHCGTADVTDKDWYMLATDKDRVYLWTAR